LVAVGQTYWCAGQTSVPSFPVKVNARQHGIERTVTRFCSFPPAQVFYENAPPLDRQGRQM
jgi:hypothetical protein